MTTAEEVEASRQPARTILLRSIEGGAAGQCRSCRKLIRWGTTQAGKKMPIDAGAPLKRVPGVGIEVSTDHVHWATCPNAKQHRREQRTAPSERID